MGAIGAIEKLIHSFSENQKQVLFESLLELIEKLNKAGIITVQRMCFSCRFYEPGKENDYRKLLKKKLYKPDLRVDCPEHEAALLLVLQFNRTSGRNYNCPFNK